MSQIQPKNDRSLIKAAGTSKSTAIAGTMAGILRGDRTVEAQAIGAGAVSFAKASGSTLLYTIHKLYE